VRLSMVMDCSQQQTLTLQVRLKAYIKSEQMPRNI